MLAFPGWHSLIFLENHDLQQFHLVLANTSEFPHVFSHWISMQASFKRSFMKLPTVRTRHEQQLVVVVVVSLAFD